MFVYLDANLIQYCADHGEFLFGALAKPDNLSADLQRELVALRELIEVALGIESRDTGNRWCIAGPKHLVAEPLDGEPMEGQREVYEMLQAAWVEDHRATAPARDRIRAIDVSLAGLGFARKDRLLLAEAIALGASWFLTCDKRLWRNVNARREGDRQLRSLRVAFPSECAKIINFGSVFGLKSVD